MKPTSFSERMAEGRELAQVARNRGLHTGKSAAGWNVTRPKLTGLDALEAFFETWKKDVHVNAYSAVEWALFGDDWKDLCEF